MELAVVTGAGSGIGRATALALSSRGFRVVCVGRRSDVLEQTVELAGDALPLPADISSESGVTAVREAVAAEGGSLQTLVHAAGIEGIHPFAGTDRARFEALVATNLGGPFFLTQALTRAFADGGSVVFVSSVAAVRGRERHAAYAATKAGLLGLTVNLAAELAPRVRVNCICPGAVNTAMFADAVQTFLADTPPEEAARALAPDRGRMLLGVGQPEQIATTIVHLALDASFCTGTIVFADGGYTAR